MFAMYTVYNQTINILEVGISWIQFQSGLSALTKRSGFIRPATHRRNALSRQQRYSRPTLPRRVLHKPRACFLHFMGYPAKIAGYKREYFRLFVIARNLFLDAGKGVVGIRNNRHLIFLSVVGNESTVERGHFLVESKQGGVRA